MERQRSFSLPLKSTLLLTFFSLLASSFLIFFSFSFWIFASSPTLILHETHLHFNSSSSPLSVRGKDSILIGARLEEPGNVSGSVEWAVLDQVPEEEQEEEEDDDDEEMEGKLQDDDEVTAANVTVTDESRGEGVKGGRVEAEEESGRCDLMNGRWVYDESYPLYANSTCPYIDEGFDCDGNGRKDKSYMKWRWQPHACEMPR